MGVVVPTSQEFNLINHSVVHLFMCLLFYALKIKKVLILVTKILIP